MRVNIIQQPILIYSGNLLPYLYNNKREMNNFKVLYDRSWGTSIIAVRTITSAANIAPNKARPIMEYGVKP
jgi:hypothetical protein